MNDVINNMILKAKAKGYTVLAPEKVTSYFWIVDGDRIGYCQYNSVTGETFSTVHKPSKYNGTGYKVDNMEDALSYVPAWVSGQHHVQKYRSKEDFIKSHWQSLAEV